MKFWEGLTRFEDDLSLYAYDEFLMDSVLLTLIH